MDDIENPDAPLPAPRAARFGEGAEGKGARRERGLSGPQSRPARSHGAVFARRARGNEARVVAHG